MLVPLRSEEKRYFVIQFVSDKMKCEQDNEINQIKCVSICVNYFLYLLSRETKRAGPLCGA